MSASAASAADWGALAGDLLRRARATFAVVPADDRGPALAALDAFLAAPGPAQYLAATRVLAEARRTRTLQKVRTAQAGYAFARGLDAVRRELGSAAAEALAVGPTDPRAGHRLRALALLAAAHRELAERVAGSTEALRRQLGLATEKPPLGPSPRRRPPAKPSQYPPRRRAPA